MSNTGENLFRERRICVVGNINRDVKAAAIPEDHRLFQDGETSVRWIAESVGGGGANSACAAAALGANVSFVGKVGTDGLAGRLERTLQKHRVAAYLARSTEFPTGTSLALSFSTGHRHFLSSLPASQRLSFRDIDLRALSNQEHLLRADVWFSESMLFEGNRQLLENARNNGLAVSLDINWDPQWNVAEQKAIEIRKVALRRVLDTVNLAHGNVRELCTFAGAADLESALQRIVDWGAEAVVVHLGERGAGYFNGSELVIEPPVPTQAQIHSTGTGDVLSVCMMLLHNSSMPIRDRLRLSNQIVSEFIEGRRQLIPPLAD